MDGATSLSVAFVCSETCEKAVNITLNIHFSVWRDCVERIDPKLCCVTHCTVEPLIECLTVE